MWEEMKEMKEKLENILRTKLINVGINRFRKYIGTNIFLDIKVKYLFDGSEYYQINLGVKKYEDKDVLNKIEKAFSKKSISFKYCSERMLILDEIREMKKLKEIYSKCLDLAKNLESTSSVSSQSLQQARESR